VRPKRRWEVVAQIVSEDLPVEVTCRVVGVSVSGFYTWRKRKPSPRAVRHAMLAEVIREVHDASRQTYGARRVHAELVLGRQISVARCTVELVMRHLGLTGLPGRPKYRKIPNTPTAEDLVNRDFARTEPTPALAHRHHRAPDPGGQGVLRGPCSTPSPAGSSAGRSTPHRPPAWSSTHWGWRSRTAKPGGASAS
jgi:transposase InsO family protein